MKFDLALKVLGWVIPIILAPIVYLLAKALLNATRFIDDLPSWAKQITVGLLGVTVVAVLSALGITVPPECIALPDNLSPECSAALTGPTVMKGITAALTAMFLHHLKKADPRR